LTLDGLRRETFRLLGDTYAMHRFLLKAFPDAASGGPGKVLYRVESGKGEARALLQSEKMPDWSDMGEVIRQVRGPKEVRLTGGDGSPVYAEGQMLRFRLRANPTYREFTDPTLKQDGKRRAWTKPDEQCKWLKRKGEQHGFALIPLPSGEDWFDPFPVKSGEEDTECRMELRIIKRDHLTGRKPVGDGRFRRIEHFAVDFDGVLRVTDPQEFVEAVRCGIGPAKGFGFGLLSVAPSW
jgi:CRISPR system Cascade subunit CasE